MFFSLENSDLSSYADENRVSSSGNNLEQVKQTLMGELQIVTKWFNRNYMVLNLGKCHFMFLRKNNYNKTFFYNNTEMRNSSKEKLSEITIDNKLKFKSHVKKLRKKNSQKICLCHV